MKGDPESRLQNMNQSMDESDAGSVRDHAKERNDALANSESTTPVHSNVPFQQIAAEEVDKDANHSRAALSFDFSEAVVDNDASTVDVPSRKVTIHDQPEIRMFGKHSTIDMPERASLPEIEGAAADASAHENGNQSGGSDRTSPSVPGSGAGGNQGGS